MKKSELLFSSLFTIAIVVFLSAYAIYHFMVPCEYHRMIDTAQSLPARCLTNAK